MPASQTGHISPEKASASHRLRRHQLGRNIEPELTQISAQLAGTIDGGQGLGEVIGERVGGGNDLEGPAGPGVAAGAGARWICMLVLRISPAQTFGCLCPERIAGRRGVAVQC